jgi:dihydroflavonol-4-reductase
MRFAGKRVYLTGATGYVGMRLASKLAADGAEVTALVRPQTAAHDLERLGAKVVRGDVTQPATLDLTGQNVVIHNAAWVGYGLPTRKRPLLRRTNVGGTQNVLHAAERAGVGKVVHVSSVAALGGAAGVVTEESVRGATFLSDYERSKTEAHALALASPLPKAVPMPGLVVGLGGPFDRLLRALAKGRVPALPGDDAVKGWVHLEDAAEGILLCALKGSGAYLLVDENLRATELFVAALEEAGLPVPRRRVRSSVLVGGAAVLERAYNLAGKTPPVSKELLDGLRAPMQYDATKARKDLGWRPQLVQRLAEDLQVLAKA